MRIDIHQHLNFLHRSDEDFIQHQKDMGIDLTVLLPSNGKDGLRVSALGPEAAYRFTQDHDGFLFAANALPSDQKTVAAYLDKGAKLIGELKFNAPGDSPDLWSYAEVAQQYNVPILIHFEPVLGITLDEFAATLRRFPTVNFIGHAVQWWRERDGLTSRLLDNFDNLYGDVSAGSGCSAIVGNSAFVEKYADRLVFGSDCSDPARKERCHGRRMISFIRTLSPEIQEKLFHKNTARLLRLSEPYFS
ncbi:MAG: amidohydrolase [Gemmatimonadetes bacterium]|nr:amidohydrolase [Gemmatimonadota bacterium]|tara:strand:+ start:3850 stop:4590 length:741 start_codon:yes stop_codon:yes gene_type:complete